MIVSQVTILLCLFICIAANPVHQNARLNLSRQRRGLKNVDWDWLDILYQRNYNSNDQIYENHKRFERPIELRPVEGPINIEQLPAMLAARYVKRYPFSQKNDPAIM